MPLRTNCQRSAGRLAILADICSFPYCHIPASSPSFVYRIIIARFTAWRYAIQARFIHSIEMMIHAATLFSAMPSSGVTPHRPSAHTPFSRDAPSLMTARCHADATRRLHGADAPAPRSGGALFFDAVEPRIRFSPVAAMLICR